MTCLVCPQLQRQLHHLVRNVLLDGERVHLPQHSVQQHAHHHHNARLLAVTGLNHRRADLLEGLPVVLRQKGLAVGAEEDKKSALKLL